MMNKTKVVFVFSAVVALLSADSNATDTLEDFNEKKSSCCFCSFLSRFSLRNKHVSGQSRRRAEEYDLVITVPRVTDTNKLLEFSSHLILEITTFLDHSNQLKLSHVSKKFKHELGEDFWENKIQRSGYLVWDLSLPKAKVFFANYCYYRGFGRDPRLPEKVETRKEHITSIPSILFAEKALALGFPKGRENYRQVQHKICMDNVSHSSEPKPDFYLSSGRSIQEFPKSTLAQLSGEMMFLLHSEGEFLGDL